MFTQAQIDQFHRDGIIVAKGVIQGEELVALRKAADRVVEEGIADTAKPTIVIAATPGAFRPISAAKGCGTGTRCSRR